MEENIEKDYLTAVRHTAALVRFRSGVEYLMASILTTSAGNLLSEHLRFNPKLSNVVLVRFGHNS